MRRIVVVAVPVLLACAGVLEPELAPRSYRAVSLDLLDGTVSEERDLGAQGDVSVEWLTESQSLNWDPVDPGLDATGRMLEHWGGVELVLANLPDAPPLEASGPVTSTVDGQDAASMEGILGQEILLVTTWLCPTTGVGLTLSSTGIPARARKLHDATLASARCGNELVGLDVTATSWAFTGDPRRWTPQPADPGDGQWVRDDGEVTLVAASLDSLLDHDLPGLCLTTMRQVHENLAATYTFDESRTSFADTPDGCTYAFEGRTDDRLVHGRIQHTDCGGGRAYTLTCLVFGDGDPLHACKDTLTCASR